jgi:hypothetical protein
LVLVEQSRGLVASALPAKAAWLSQRQREGVSLSSHHASELEDLLASMRQRENIWLPWHERGPLGSRRASERIGGFLIASGGRPERRTKTNDFTNSAVWGGFPRRRSQGSLCGGVPPTRRGHMQNPGRMAEETGGKKMISPLAELLNLRNSVYRHVVGFGRSSPRGLRSARFVDSAT